jgi:hypothetical protein
MAFDRKDYGVEYLGLTGRPEDLNIEASKHVEPQK